MIKHPNGYFKVKPCRCCGTEFQPQAPSELYCSPDCKVLGNMNAYLMRTYGIGAMEYQKKLKEQNGCCAICGGKGFRMASHHRMDLVVDHDHDTGRVRSLLCHNCNRALGLLKDSPEVVSRAHQYLTVHGKGVTTIPQGSTPQAIGGGSARPLKTIEGEEIVWTRRQRRAA